MADFSGEMFINALGEQGTCLLGGLKADDLARLKDSSPPAFGAAIDGAKWGELVLTLQSRSREYNGELRMRHQVTNARPVDFAADGAKLLELIGRYN